MKAKIISYVDYQNADLLTQQKLILTTKIQGVALRNISGMPLIDADEKILNEYKNFLVKAKTPSIVLDPAFEAYSLNNENERQYFVKQWQKSIEVAQLFRTEYLYYVIPKVKDILAEQATIIELIKNDLLYAKKYKGSIVIKFSGNMPSNIYFYIIDRLKKESLTICFDPTYMFKNKESMTTDYRIFRDYFNLVQINDVDIDFNPRLIGFGKIDYHDLFKRMSKQDKNFYLILDLQIIESIKDANKKVSVFTKLKPTYRNQMKIYQDLLARVESNDPAAIINHQISILNKMGIS